MPAANLAHHPPGRRHHPRLELPRRQRARPCIENLQHVGAGLHLARQVLDRRLDQQIDQPSKATRIAICPQPRLALVGRALPLHHVGRHRPRRAAKADERRLPRQILPQPRDRFADEGELGPSRVPAQARKIRLRCARDRDAAPRPRRRPPSGPAHRAPRGCRRTGSPRRSRSAGSAAASPRRPAPACSTDRGSRRLSRARPGTPAGIARPAASARSAVATPPRRRTVSGSGASLGSGGNDIADLSFQESKDLNLVIKTLRRWVSGILAVPFLCTGCALTGAVPRPLACPPPACH